MRADRNRHLLLAGDGFSAFGGWIDFLAILTLAAYQFQVSPYEMAIVSAAGLLPGILAGPFVGRLCDRGDAKQVLLVSIVGRVLATGAILACHQYFAFVALVGLRSVFATVAPPAINVMAVRSIEAAALPRFYSLLNVLNNSAKVLAPAIGTVSSSIASERVALGMSLACSVAAFAIFWSIRMSPKADASAGAQEGVHTRAPAPNLAPLIWVVTTAAFFVFMVNNLVPVVLHRAGFDKALLGLLVGCSGAGNILSGLWLAKRAASAPMHGRLRELVLPATLQAIGFGAIGLLLWVQPAFLAPLLCALFFVIGTFSARYAIAMSVHVAAHHSTSIGRVWGVVSSWQSAMILVAPMVGAAVLEGLGPVALFAFATASGLLSFALLSILKKLGVGRLDRSAEALRSSTPA